MTDFILVKELVGGLTNQLFLCEDGETGKKVVYRVYGMIQDDPYERMVELSICTLLGANKIGPNILGEILKIIMMSQKLWCSTK